MIGRLRSVIIEKQPPLVLIEVDDVGYEVHMPMVYFHELLEVGQEATVFAHFAVCEDARPLYGFNDRQERTLFKELIKASDVDPKLALAILSGASMQQFANVVKHEEMEALVKLPGTGERTTEHLIIEMKDRFKGLHGDLSTPATDLVLTSPASPTTDNVEQKAVAALVALGYKPQGASHMISKIARPDTSNETLIHEVLRAAL